MMRLSVALPASPTGHPSESLTGCTGKSGITLLVNLLQQRGIVKIWFQNHRYKMKRARQEEKAARLLGNDANQNGCYGSGLGLGRDVTETRGYLSYTRGHNRILSRADAETPDTPTMTPSPSPSPTPTPTPTPPSSPHFPQARLKNGKEDNFFWHPSIL
ncbi:unnamed protein product [Protopolystoma xenopodis]|uniref:Homeobox domain-containing protein n=1 Tax=Protopolystoma xenopodis TaxID=117903 RepID=A0A3S5B3Z4_9PLAT|nr:unnamed protein product [Protopolystoma xenopodis]